MRKEYDSHVGYGSFCGIPGRVVEGSITLDGRDITHLSPRELAKVRGNEISMIFQEPMTSLNPVYPVGRQVREAILQHQKISKEEARKRVLEIFQAVGIPEPEKRYNSYPHQLSRRTAPESDDWNGYGMSAKSNDC